MPSGDHFLVMIPPYLSSFPSWAACSKVWILLVIFSVVPTTDSWVGAGFFVSAPSSVSPSGSGEEEDWGGGVLTVAGDLGDGEGRGSDAGEAGFGVLKEQDKSIKAIIEFSNIYMYFEDLGLEFIKNIIPKFQIVSYPTN